MKSIIIIIIISSSIIKQKANLPRECKIPVSKLSWVFAYQGHSMCQLMFIFNCNHLENELLAMCLRTFKDTHNSQILHEGNTIQQTEV